jgi:transposase
MKMANVTKIMGTKEIDKVAKDETLSKSARVKLLFEGGLGVKEIAAAVGIRYNFAYNVISNYVIVNGIEVETEKKATKKDAVWALLDAGKTVKEIAIELKTNYNYVYKLKKEWELTRNTEKSMDELVEGGNK